MLAVKAERQENDRGWGTDRTEENDGQTTDGTDGKYELYYSGTKKTAGGS